MAKTEVLSLISLNTHRRPSTVPSQTQQHYWRLVVTLEPRRARSEARDDRELMAPYPTMLPCTEFPEDAEHEDQEKPQPSDPSGGAAGNRRNPPGGRSTLILG